MTGPPINPLARAPGEHVNRSMGTLTVPDTTSKNRRALVRPLTRRVLAILEAVESRASGGYIFPGRCDGQPLNNTRKLQLTLQARTGLWITPHDLRRVWTSAASRAGLPAVVIKRLLNHASRAEEVTEGYIRVGLDELLDHAQSVEDMILGDAGLLASRHLDTRLADLLAGLPEADKQRLLAGLVQRQQGETG